ncbi:10397_t:CDS:2, partial [Gigaspora rosea]
NFQTVLPMIECSDNFKEHQADLPFFLSNDNNDNLIERFKTALTLFPDKTNIVEQVIDLELQNYMDVEVQGSIDKELSQESSELKNTAHIK